MTQWVRTPDSVIGAVGGSALGLLSYLLFSKKKKKSDALLHILGGAALGTVGANVGGTLARRYVSNTVVPAGYGSKEVADAMKPTSLGDAWAKLYRHAIKDEPALNLHKAVSTGSAAEGTTFARRELVRRNMGVHNTDIHNDWFRDNADGSVRVNEAVLGRSFGANSSEEKTRDYLRNAVEHELTYKAPALGDADTSSKRHSGRFAPLLGGYKREVTPTQTNITDEWTYKISPAQKKYLGQAGLAAIGLGKEPDLKALVSNDEDSQYYYPHDTASSVKRSLGMRYIANQLLDTQDTKVKIPIDKDLYKSAIK